MSATECQHGTFTTIALPTDAETLAYQAGRMAEQHGPAIELTSHGDHLDVHRPKPPTPEPGTKGTADLTNLDSGNKALGLPCMRTNDGYAFPGTTVTDDSAVYQVSNFVPDEDRARLAVEQCRHLHQDGLTREEWHKRHCGAVQPLQGVGEFVAEIDTDILHDGSYVEILRAEWANLTRQRDEARAAANRWQAEGDRLRARLDLPCPGTHCGEEAVCPAAPESRPAFVLPDEDAVMDVIAERLMAHAVGLTTPQIGNVSRHTTRAVLALLAEHAVTEVRLTDALRERVGDAPAARKKAAVVLARLAGKAED